MEDCKKRLAIGSRQPRAVGRKHRACYALQTSVQEKKEKDIRPSLTNVAVRAGTWALKRGQENKLNVAEIRMLR